MNGMIFGKLLGLLVLYKFIYSINSTIGCQNNMSHHLYDEFFPDYDESINHNILNKNIIEEKENIINYLKSQVKLKDAMIDWLTARLQSYCNNPLIINCAECRKKGCHNHNWRKASEVAVTPNLYVKENVFYVKNEI